MTGAKQLRVSEAIDHLDQANAIFNYVLFALGDFKGIGDPKWDHRLAAAANVANLLRGYSGDESENIARASREIVTRRLPRLLCIALVSAIETCFQALTEMTVRELRPKAPDDEVMKEARKVNAGGPLQYLPRLAELLGLPTLVGPEWVWFPELVATRNVLVHASEPMADKTYVRSAGPSVRAKEGQPLKVDNTYLIENYVQAKGAFLALLREAPTPAGGRSVKLA